MADAQDIKFKLSTEGDTKGAEKVIEAIKDTGAEAKKVNEEARRAEQEELRVSDREANLRSRAVEFVKLGETIRKYGQAAAASVGDIDGLSESTKRLATSAAEGAEQVGGVISRVSQGFAAGGPIGAVVAAAASAFGIILGKVKETDVAMDSAEASGKRAEGMWRKLQDLKLKLPLIESLEAANALLDEQYAKFVRNERVAGADRALAQTQTSSAVADQVAGGQITANAGAAKVAAAQMEGDISEVQARLQGARLEIAKMSTDAGDLRAEGLRAAEGSADQLKLFKQADDLLDKQKTAALDFIADETAAASEMQSLATKGGQELKEAGRKGADEIFSAAENMRDAIDQAVAAQGKNASAGAKGVADMVNSLLSDGIMSAEDMGRIKEGIGRLNGLTEKNNPAVLAAVNKMVTLLESDASVIKPLQQRIQTLEQTFEQLRASSTSFPPP